jgi:hypothetical protein
MCMSSVAYNPPAVFRALEPLDAEFSLILKLGSCQCESVSQSIVWFCLVGWACRGGCGLGIPRDSVVFGGVGWVVGWICGVGLGGVLFSESPPLKRKDSG